jgi:hypothetical protein
MVVRLGSYISEKSSDFGKEFITSETIWGISFFSFLNFVSIQAPSTVILAQIFPCPFKK